MTSDNGLEDSRGSAREEERRRRVVGKRGCKLHESVSSKLVRKKGGKRSAKLETRSMEQTKPLSLMPTLMLFSREKTANRPEKAHYKVMTCKMGTKSRIFLHSAPDPSSLTLVSSRDRETGTKEPSTHCHGLVSGYQKATNNMSGKGDAAAITRRQTIVIRCCDQGTWVMRCDTQSRMERRGPKQQ